METMIFVLRAIRDFLDDLIEKLIIEEKPAMPDLPAIDSSKTSPNQSSRDETKIDLIVLHNTDGSIEGSIEHFSKQSSQVSAHYLVSREGNTYRMVPEHRKAWHARQENSRSIGIEIEAYASRTGMTTAQNSAVVALVRDIQKRLGLTNEQVGVHRQFCNTDCPVHIWPSDAGFNEWKGKYL